MRASGSQTVVCIDLFLLAELALVELVNNVN